MAKKGPRRRGGQEAGDTLSAHAVVGSLPDLLLEFGRDGQAAFVLVTASSIEDSLEELLKMRMPRLSKNLRDELFSGFGPLNSAKARIDLA